MARRALSVYDRKGKGGGAARAEAGYEYRTSSAFHTSPGPLVRHFRHACVVDARAARVVRALRVARLGGKGGGWGIGNRTPDPPGPRNHTRSPIVKSNTLYLNGYTGPAQQSIITTRAAGSCEFARLPPMRYAHRTLAARVAAEPCGTATGDDTASPRPLVTASAGATLISAPVRRFERGRDAQLRTKATRIYARFCYYF